MSRDGPSIDSVRAEEVGVFDPAADTTEHTWGTPAPVPVSITLAQSTPESRAGTVNGTPLSTGMVSTLPLGNVTRYTTARSSTVSAMG